jgi:hypothetical protein
MVVVVAVVVMIGDRGGEVNGNKVFTFIVAMGCHRKVNSFQREKSSRNAV